MDFPPIKPASYNSAVLLLEKETSLRRVKETKIFAELGKKSILETFPTARPLMVTFVPI